MNTAHPLRPVVIIAGVLGAALLVAVLVVSLVVGAGDENAPQDDSTAPLAVPTVPAPQAGSPTCRGLLAALPTVLRAGGTDLEVRELAEPAPDGVRAWGGDPVVLLRCGVAKPGELTRTAQLRTVSGVSWLPVDGPDATTWYTVDRANYVALTVPAGVGTGALQTVSATVRQNLPPRAS